MGIRRESVYLSLDGTYLADVAKAAVGTDVLARSLSDRPGGLAGEARRAGTQIDTLSGRLGLLTRAAAALGPAFIPVSTIAVPAVTGLAAQLGIAALAGGTAVIAFQGVGDALDALNKYQLEPTADNLAKVEQAFSSLDPAAQSFITTLDRLGPVFTDIRNAAAGGLFPGLEDALVNVAKLKPTLMDLVAETGDALGDNLERVSESLNSDRWAPFFDFIENEARPTLDALFMSLGNVTHGMANMWMAFDPLNDDFSDWLVRVTGEFDVWSAKLSETQGFQEFVQYIRDTGPQVAETLGSIGDAVLQILEAAAPLGGPILKALEAFADIIAALADSPLGTPIMTAVTAMSALSLATSAWAAVAKTSVGGFVTGIGSSRTALGGLRADIRTMAGEYASLGGARSSALSLASGTTGAAQRTRSRLATGAKAGATGVGVGLLASGAGDQLGVSTALTGGLIGATVGGVPGAAVGVAVGGLVDIYKAANAESEAFTASVERADAAASGLLGTFDELGQATADTGAAILAGIGSEGVSQLQAMGFSLDEIVEKVQAGDDGLRGLGVAASTFGDFETLGGLPAIMEGYASATEEAALQQEYAAETADDYGFAVERAQVKISATQETMGAFREAIREQRKDAVGTARSFLDISTAAGDAELSLDGFIQSLEDQAEALRRFRDNAREAADKGLRKGLIRELEALGPVGAVRMQQLADATEDQIGRANDAWAKGRGAMKEWVDYKVPPKRVEIELDKLRTQIAELRALINGVPTERTITYRVNRVGRELGNMYADGGKIYGPGGPRDDKVPVWASNGEFIVNAKATKMFEPELRFMNAQGFADGGVVQQRGYNNGGGGASLMIPAGTRLVLETDVGAFGATVRGVADGAIDDYEHAGRASTGGGY